MGDPPAHTHTHTNIVLKYLKHTWAHTHTYQYLTTTKRTKRMKWSARSPFCCIRCRLRRSFLRPSLLIFVFRMETQSRTRNATQEDEEASNVGVWDSSLLPPVAVVSFFMSGL